MNKSNIIYGLHAVIEALNSGNQLERIFVQKGLKSDLVKELMYKIHITGTPISKVPVERINKFTRKNHQGVVGLISPIQYAKIEHLIPELYEQGEIPLILVLDQITDVRNFGAIGRSAECLGVHGIVIPIKGSVQVNEDAMKTSAGAFNYLPVCREENLLETIQLIKNSGIQVIGCTEKTETKLSELDFGSPTAIIMGSEEHGISSDLLAKCDAVCKIPMKGNISSLNVSVAAGIVLYEATRQRI